MMSGVRGLSRIIVVWLTIVLAAAIEPGPKYRATKGAVWPRPKQQTFYHHSFSVKSDSFEIIATHHTCLLLSNAIQRYTRLISILASARQGGGRSSPPRLAQLQVRLYNACEEIPHIRMDEKYELTVGVDSSRTPTAILESESIWGVIRGLETFSQLLYHYKNNKKELTINATVIEDEPEYAHRGLLIDTSRHFISVSNILLMLDGMACNKLNVLHWHIVDDQSFPYVSGVFPRLSAMGAYGQRAVYSQQDVLKILEYARLRGIRVMPEFDVPGHTRSWGEAYPELLTKCYKNNQLVGLGPLDPSKNTTYTFLASLFNEVIDLFHDQYLHIGGDEVDYSCWGSNPDVQEYMRTTNLSGPLQLHGLFTERAAELATEAGARPVVWQEAVDAGATLAPGTIVHVWKDQEIKKLISAGYNVLYSTCWYLDHLKSGGDWRDYYACSPRAFAPPQYTSRVIGGEACMWGEVVDDTNVLSRIFPRVCATAERLWSRGPWDAEEAARRLEEMTCRLRARGVPAQPPNGPSYCH